MKCEHRGPDPSPADTSEQYDTDSVTPARVDCPTKAARVSSAPRAVIASNSESVHWLAGLPPFPLDATAGNSKPLLDAPFISKLFVYALVSAVGRCHLLDMPPIEIFDAISIDHAVAVARWDDDGGAAPFESLRRRHHSRAGRDGVTTIRLPRSVWGQIDRWRLEQGAKTRSEAIQRLLGQALGTDPGRHTSRKLAAKASDLAGRVIDRLADRSATGEEQAKRKRRLVKGPREFRTARRNVQN